MVDLIQVNKPLWTERLYPARGGQDHLGVGSVVTDRMLPTLAPGINVLTRHPRYWSFYAFVIDEFWNSDSPRTRAAFRTFLRRKEFIFAAANLLLEPEARTQVIGTRLVGPLVESAPAKLRADFKYMKSSGGGYGLYYATAMQTMGVVRLADPDLNLPVDALTPEVGKPLAYAFREAIRGTTYWKKYLEKDEIPRGVVEEYGETCALWKLRDRAVDRPLVVNAFLHGGRPEMAAARRKTLQLMLEISKQTAKVGVSEAEFRSLLLYGSVLDDSGARVLSKFSPPAELASTARQWRLTQLREMFNWSLNGLWQWLCEWGTANNNIDMPIAIQQLEVTIKRMTVRSIRGLRSSPSKPIEQLVEEIAVASDVSQSLDGKWNALADVTEFKLMKIVEESDKGGSEKLGALITMYVLTLLRIRGVQTEQSAEAMLSEGGMRRVGMQWALQSLSRDIQTEKTIAETVLRILRDNVLTQHERVAMAKLPDDTFRFRREGDSIRFFDQWTDYRMNNSRFISIATACGDFGWTDYLDLPNRKLSHEGEQIRSAGDLGTK